MLARVDPVAMVDATSSKLLEFSLLLNETAEPVPPHPVGIRQWRLDACGVAGDGSGEQAVEVAKQFHR